MALNLYVGEPQHDNFAHMDDLFPTRAMPQASSPQPFVQGRGIGLPEHHSFDGSQINDCVTMRRT